MHIHLSVRRLGCLFGLGAALTWAHAAQLVVTEPQLGADGRFSARAPADAATYFVLLRGSQVTQIQSPVALALGAVTPVALTDPDVAVNRATAFYRLQQVPLAQPLDTDADGMDDVFELQHAADLSPLDSADAAKPAGDGRTWLERYRNADPGVTTLAETSPREGEGSVSVTRETFVRFSAPLAADTLIGHDDFHAEFGGRRLLSRTELSSDRRTATLFYLENLPSGARVQVTFRGDRLKDAAGRNVDADGDGQPGGIRGIGFDTVSMTPIAHTAVSGRIYRSDLAPGAVNSGNVIERPLQGVNIEVIGAEETVRTTTDAEGRFTLSPSPAGRFFVRIDGRPCTSHLTGDLSLPWAQRAYYPVIEKAWEVAAGRTDNLAGAPLSTDGVIYLPLVAAGTLQPVSATQDTLIGFPAAVTAANPELAGVSIMVPANSLMAENGARGGMVGIAPVASGRLPEPLPPGLKHTLDISIQTDGPQNFDRPVPVRFPNLPDPDTGERLPPGAKSALWSFSHDLGRWEIAGPMTVTADGNFLESDPGVGVTRPGWHGTMPGTPPDSTPPHSGREPSRCGSTQLESDCKNGAIASASDCALSFIPGPPSAAGCFALASANGALTTVRDCLLGDGAGDCALATVASASGITLGCIFREVPGFGQALACTLAAINVFDKCTPCFIYNISSSGSLRVPRPAGTPERNPALVRYEAVVGYLEAVVAMQRASLGTDRWVNLIDPQVGDNRLATEQIRQVLGAILGAGDKGSVGGSRVTDAELQSILALPRPAVLEEALIRSTVTYIRNTEELYARGLRTHAAAGRNDFMDVDEFLAAVNQAQMAIQRLRDLGVDELNLDDEHRRLYAMIQASYTDLQPGALDSSRVCFLLRNETTGAVFRGRLRQDGSLPLAALTPRCIYRASYYEPTGRLLARNAFETADSGFATKLPTPLMFPVADTEPDTDADGLPDVAESVLGTEVNNPDSDGDGISDGAEIQQNTNPLDNRPAATGIIATAATGGNAVDVSALNGLAVVANANGSVTVFNVAGVNPVRVAQVPTPGPSLRVANAGGFAAVACGDAGLVILDLSDLAAVHVSHTVTLGSAVKTVAVAGNVAYVACVSGRIAAVDLATGTVLTTRDHGGDPISDFAVAGDYLYALSFSGLSALPLDGKGLRVVGSTFSLGGLRIVAGGGLAHVTYSGGVNLFSLADPALPAFLLQNSTAQSGWQQMAPSGSGPGLACVGVFQRPEDVNLYDLGPDGRSLTFQTTFATPGDALALSIYNGLAYVADGAAGLQVINYLAHDNKKQPPTIALSSNFAVIDSAPVIEEGKLARLTASVTDDVQVRNVEFYVDGVKALTDGNFPFEHRFIAPTRSATKTTFTVRAKATDTGGNAAWSEPITVTLSEDVTPPELVRILPPEPAGKEDLRQLVVRFSEPLNRGSVTAESFRLRDAGPDLVFDTADDALVTRGSFTFDDANSAVYLRFDPALASGRYRLELAATLTDRAGLPLPAAVTNETFTGYGWRGEYFQLLFNNEPGPLQLSRLDRDLDFNWNFTAPDPAVNVSFFGRWSGRVTPRFSEVYEFMLPEAASRSRLWVDGQLLFDGIPSGTPRGSIFLAAGQPHDLILEHAVNGFGRTRLTWSSPSQPEEVVPFALLRPPVDTRAPGLLAARGEPTLDRVFLRFDETLDRASAETVANYLLTPAVTVRSAALLANGRDVALSTAPLAESTRHALRVTGVRDAAGNTAVGTAAFTTVRLVPGGVRREFYDAPNTGEGVTPMASPGWPVLPDTLGLLPSFASAPFNGGADANRALAFLQPTDTATHRFLLHGGVGNTLLFAPPDGPERELAVVPPFDSLRYAFSEPVRLVSGQRYRLELRGNLARVAANFAVNSALASAYDRSVVVELEDYDFDGGQHVAGASARPYAPGQYTNRLGTPGVDFQVESGSTSPYRPSDFTQPALFGPDRTAYHGGVLNTNSYSLQLSQGEWANYTRVLPANRYHVYLAFTAVAFPDFRLGRVTAGAGTPEQPTTELGRFVGGDSGGRLIRLTDGAGQAVELEFDGLTTLRLTASGQNFASADYLLFVPVAAEPSDPKLLLEPSPFNPPLAGAELLAPLDADGTGFLLRETWTDVTAATIAEFRASAAANLPPNQTARVNRFELERSQVFGTAVTRLRGWVVPYRDGPHRFFVSASRRAELFLSPDEQPEHLALAATEPTGTQPTRSWFNSASLTRDPAAPENRTAVLNLEAGQRYAVEVWIRHLGFDDHVGVTWHPPGTLQPANGAEPISGLHLVAPDQP